MSICNSFQILPSTKHIHIDNYRVFGVPLEVFIFVEGGAQERKDNGTNGTSLVSASPNISLCQNAFKETEPNIHRRETLCKNKTPLTLEIILSNYQMIEYAMLLTKCGRTNDLILFREGNSDFISVHVQSNECETALPQEKINVSFSSEQLR
ncbi:hypothetical protein HELRODRAFT_174163 [Helobdella robusta]|uniref:Uncharacterized protein n=1 Tax=Helobdella robusta TaxID=6412 RepID=T1F7Q0_HELRO|nr:hypothetical protein HELRODRAFT_174163 [Helobdella robusta]ESO02758.1 hypothetical protein HELRODRAFT_174163 [Helobdella robusta]